MNKIVAIALRYAEYGWRDPPLAWDEVRKIASGVRRYKPAEEGAFR